MDLPALWLSQIASASGADCAKARLLKRSSIAFPGSLIVNRSGNAAQCRSRPQANRIRSLRSAGMFSHSQDSKPTLPLTARDAREDVQIVAHRDARLCLCRISGQGGQSTGEAEGEGAAEARRHRAA